MFRAFFSTPDSIKGDDGKPINAAYGFINMLARLVSDNDPDFLACADDRDWRPEWRVELISTYKTHRVAPGSESPQATAEDALEHQLPILYEVLEACRIPIVGFDGYEAEDVIGTLAHRAPGPVRIVSGDRDLFQLVADPRVVILYPKRGVSEVVKVDASYIESKYGIPGNAYADFAIMRGDPSDGLPGVPGIGEKTAATLLARYESLERVVEAAITGEGTGALGKIKMNLDYLDRAVKVVTIPTDLPIPDVDLTRPREGPPSDVLELAETYGLAGPVRRLAAALSGPSTSL